VGYHHQNTQNPTKPNKTHEFIRGVFIRGVSSPKHAKPNKTHEFIRGVFIRGVSSPKHAKPNKAHEFIRGVFIRGVFYSWGIITKTRKTQQNPRIYSWGIYSWGIITKTRKT
jgi:NAD-dependent SIR2 family protein deacetylase